MDMIAIKTKAKVTCAEMRRRLESIRFSSPRSRLNSDQERGVRALETDGAYVTSLDELGVPFDGACKAEIEQLYEKISFKSHGRKSFRGVVPREATEQSHNLLLWGLNEALLNVVESYLRVPANFRGFVATLDLADGDETDPHVEHPAHLVHRHIAVAAQELEDRRNRPRALDENGVEVGRKNSRHISDNSTPGHMHEGPDVRSHRHSGRSVDHGGIGEHIG